MENSKKTIGIVGGGQLGKMLTEAAHRLGFFVVVLDPTLGSPAATVADKHLVGNFKDKNAILELAEMCDYMTFEIESANVEALEELARKGKIVHPAPAVLNIIKDKFKQKGFLAKALVPVADFALIETYKDAIDQGKIFGYPFLLKSRFDAYDGRGNAVVKSEEEIENAFTKLGAGALYAEKFIPFVKELAVVSARDTYGTIISYPVVETVHVNNICHIVRSPAQVDESIQAKAKKLAEQVLDVLGGVGVFAVEMFLTSDGDILVNEIAPRVHNSGHHTIEAFTMSQFEAHIRAITGMPLVVPEANSRHAVMINILGERDGQALLSGDYIHPTPDANVHIYGKMETRKERKMGHITALGDTQVEAEEKALTARKNISI
jgi:phosphoribosylaminoimidazole carboxylase PurK protein